MSLRLSSPAAVFLLIFCSKTVAQPTVTVAAAADLSPLQSRLEAAFRNREPGLRVRFVIASSSVLAQQIENGAPYDVFLSANAAYIDRLVRSRKIDAASVCTYALGRVAIVWKDKNHHAMKDLAQNWVRFVAIPNPNLAPYGVAAREALQHEELWDSVSKKVVYGENVRQTLQLFDTGNADVVLTSDSLVHDRPEAQVLPATWHNPVVQKGGIVANARKRNGARSFLDFLVSPAGQAIFAQYGFSAGQ